MIYTPNESGMFWCPMQGEPCRGSRCAAWRYVEQVERRVIVPHRPVSFDDDPSKQPEPPRPAYVPDSWPWEPALDPQDVAGWVEPLREAEFRTEGYCGFAGKPLGAP